MTILLSTGYLHGLTVTEGLNGVGLGGPGRSARVQGTDPGACWPYRQVGQQTTCISTCQHHQILDDVGLVVFHVFKADS